MSIISGKRKPVLLQSVPASTLTNFPVLLKIVADSDIGAELAAGSKKLDVADPTNATRLDFEYDGTPTYSGGQYTANIWVRITILSSAAVNDVIALVGYSSAGSDTSNPAGVWDAQFKGVYHLEESPSGSAPQYKDSTGNANDGTRTGGVAQGTGEVGNCYQSDGSAAQYITGGSSGIPDSSAGAATLSCWIKTASGSFGAYPCFLWSANMGLTTFNGFYIQFNHADGSSTGAQGNYTSVTPNLNDNNWHSIVGTYDGTHCKIYYDGTLIDTDGTVFGFYGFSTNTAVIIGRGYQDQSLDGSIDEPRISNVARSADWIAWEYANAANNAATVTLGSETGGGSTYTLAAAAGSFGQTGSAAALNKGSLAAAAAGTFSETGQPATLKAARVISAATGAIALTGGAAGFGIAVPAASGSFALSGQAATLLIGKGLTAAAGAIAESGPAAGLSAMRLVGAAAGSFTETGQAAALARHVQIVTAAGAFSETGELGGLFKASRLIASAGSILWTGKAAALSTDQRIAIPDLFVLFSEGSCVSFGALYDGEAYDGTSVIVE